MHRSRLYGIIIDTPDAGPAATFWAGVFGTTAAPAPGEEEFLSLHAPLTGHGIAVQRVGEGTQPRYHLDIETDDVPAEVARLRALGAEELNDDPGYRILRAPGGGHLLCVVPVQSDPALFEADSRSW